MEARLVCRSFRNTFDANVRRATLYAPPRAAVGAELPRPPPWAAVLKLDASHMCLMKVDDAAQSLDMGRLVAMLQRWPTAAPLELDLSDNHVTAQGVHALVLALKYPGCARGGLQVLDLSVNNEVLKPSGVEHLAMLVRASPQLAALRELRLAGCGLEGAGAAALCDALQGATHVRSLTLLDLSRNYYTGTQGVAALAACLRGAPHLRSLQQLLLRGTHGGPTGVRKLAGAIAEAQLPLTALDIRGSGYGDEGAAAWAAVLPAAACLAGLEVLELGDWAVTLAGITQLATALQASTHLTRLRRLGLLPNTPGSRGSRPECVERFVHMLQHSPHLAASLQEVDLSCCALAGGALAAVCGALMADGACLPRLRWLDLPFLGDVPIAEDMRHVCTALVAGTHLTGLQRLEFQPGVEYLPDPACNELEAALSAATHLSGLRALPSALDRTPERIAGLLHAAPHLRGLTWLELRCDESAAGLGALQLSLQLLPALRSLELQGLSRGREANTLEVPAMLARAPCTPSLEELSFCGIRRGAVVRLAEALRACTRLCCLRRLNLQLHYEELGEGVHEEDAPLLHFAAVMGECRHLSRLRELGVMDESVLDAVTLQGAVWEALTRGGHIVSVRVCVFNC